MADAGKEKVGGTPWLTRHMKKEVQQEGLIKGMSDGDGS